MEKFYIYLVLGGLCICLLGAIASHLGFFDRDDNKEYADTFYSGETKVEPVKEIKVEQKWDGKLPEYLIITPDSQGLFLQLAQGKGTEGESK